MTPSGSWADLRGRLAQFGLELNGREDAADRVRPVRRRAIEQTRGLGKPETFQFLGFTHICAKDQERALQAQARHRLEAAAAKLRAVKAELMRRRHLPIPEQGRWLASVLRGHCQLLRACPATSQGAARLPLLQVTEHWYQGASAPQPAHRPDLGTDAAPASSDGYHRPAILHPWPDAPIRRQNPREEPSALVRARWDLCGGRVEPSPAKTRPYRDQARYAWPRRTRAAAGRRATSRALSCRFTPGAVIAL